MDDRNLYPQNEDNNTTNTGNENDGVYYQSQAASSYEYNPNNNYQNPGNTNQQYQGGYSANANDNMYQAQEQQPNMYSNLEQSEWAFNDYGPMSAGNGAAQNGTPRPPKKKKNGGSGAVKIFAVVVSVLFLVSIAALAGVLVSDDKQIGNSDSTSSAETDSPSLTIADTPDTAIPEVDPDTGVMTTKAVYKAVNPSVVGIITYVKTTNYQVSGQGSGVIISKDGYIVTNAHVVQSESVRRPVAKIEVVLDNKESYVATLLGADTKSDLAVLKIDADNLTPATFGDSDKVEVGDTAIVIGNPSGMDFAGSLSQGAISGVNREVNMGDSGEKMTFIQTDAAINPGNSGGALVNVYGQVVGISSAKIAATDYEGIGFAIPTNIAKPIIDSIIEHGYVKGRVRIGITYQPITEPLSQLNGIPMGLRVVDIEPTFDVAKKGIQQGDIITHINAVEVYDQTTISTALEGKLPGDSIEMSIYRVDDNGRAKTFRVSVILGEEAPTAIS